MVKNRFMSKRKGNKRFKKTMTYLKFEIEVLEREENGK